MFIRVAFSVSWAPDTIFEKELRIIGSYAQVCCFRRSVEYLDSGKVSPENGNALPSCTYQLFGCLGHRETHGH